MSQKNMSSVMLRGGCERVREIFPVSSKLSEGMILISEMLMTLYDAVDGILDGVLVMFMS